MPLPRQIFLNEAKARIDAAIDAEIGFVERLVWFWSNHFCVSVDATVMAGGYEREAIRPHVLGRFADMLLAAEGHAAMLIYLNNAQSIGPNSVAGINRDQGLNENLAREILELHTLGVRTVYTQADVTNFAKVLTGWTILPTATTRITAASSCSSGAAHEPGAQTVIGKTYPDTGVEQGRAVLADLARHPATARHVATKLARHFIADDPPPALVERLAQRFLDTDGDLKEVAKTLIAAPEVLVAGAGQDQAPGRMDRGGAARDRGAGRHPPHHAGAAPARRAAVAAAGAEGLLGRQCGLARRPGAAARHRQQLRAARRADLDPEAVLETALGPLASAETRRAIARAESKPQALALLLMAPEFQRR